MDQRSRRKFLKQIGALGAVSALPGCGNPFELSGNSSLGSLFSDGPLSPQSLANSIFHQERGRVNGSRQNVIMLSVDDLNDWISPLGGYAGEVITPNFARLAARSVNFTQAYCAAPYCGASRSSTLSGISPWISQMMAQQNILEFESDVSQRLGINQLSTIPRYFRSQGYKVLGGGKIYHGGFGHQREQWGLYDQAAWDDYFHFVWSDTTPDYRLHNNDQTLSGMIGAAYNSPSEEARMPDRALARWAISQINAHAKSEQPLFLGVGFYRPHISWFVPQRFYDMYPLSSIKVPELLHQLKDLEDLPAFAVKYLSNMSWTAYGETMPDGLPSSDHYSLFNKARVNGYDGHAQAIQAYLASISFVDECLGQVLDALEMSGMMDNSVVVLWSDHGWHLGEKLSWRKYKLWEKATRVPLMISAPGAAKGVTSSGVASLVDLFPTLIDLSSGGQAAGISGQTSGRSLRTLVEDPRTNWSGRAITSQVLPEAGGAKIYSLRNEAYRYIMYPAQGSELADELYDLARDPREQRNLLYYEPLQYQSVRRQLRSELLQAITSKS